MATDSNFFTTIIDVTTTTPQYQVEIEMENGTYYWKTASRSPSSTWNWSEVHTFTLQGGWERQRDIPKPVCDGAALAYAGAQFPGGALYAFVGGGDTSWFTYSIDGNIWLQLGDGTPPQNIGSDLATHMYPGVGSGVAFGIFAEEDWASLYHYMWGMWIEMARIPELLGPGASIAAGKLEASYERYIYLIVGEDGGREPRSHFWRINMPTYQEQEGNRSLGTQGNQRQTITQAKAQISSDGVILEYQLDALANVKAMAYDALGRLVKTLCSGYQTAGLHRLEWSPEASGAYFILLDTGKEEAKLKVVVR